MSIFSTTANTDFNSFNDPFNSMNLNQGPWGMNPAYLSPSYDAPYRPPYMGGGSHVAYQNPGFFRSMYGISPFSQGTPYGVGSHDQDDIFYSQMANRPMDAGYAFGQRIGAPLVAFGGAFAMSRAWQVRNQSRGAYDWFRAFGASRQEAMRVSGFTALGQRFGRSMAEGIIGGASRFAPGLGASAFGRIAIGGAAMLGGVASSVALPAAIAQAGIGTFNKFITDNYIGVRENQDMLRSAFRGVTFNSGDGDLFTGQGLSRRASARMGTELTRMGARDQVFNAREIASITSLSSQMGLLDNVSSDQITTRMSSIVKQLKVVMSVAQTTDFKEAINLMAKLQSAGVGPNNFASTMATLGGLSGIAGISTNRMVNTVGAQGQYLFQSNGITPFMGQVTSATAMAGMAAAFRSGLVSPELMSRLGGVEGATQLSTTGQLNAAQTTYNMMRNFNRFTSGMGGSGVIQNVSNFGTAMSQNPLAAFGAMLRTRGSNIGRQFQEDGPMAIHNQIMDIAGINPLTANKGRINADEAMGLMVGTGMMDAQQAQAYLAQLAAIQDPRTRAQMFAGLRSSQIRMNRDLLEQGGNTRFTAMFSPVTKLFRQSVAGVASLIGGGVQTGSGIGDALQNAFQRATIGSPDDLAGIRMRDLRFSENLRLFDVDKFRDARRLNESRRDPAFGFQGQLTAINNAAIAGNENALAILNSTGSAQANALFRFASSGALGDNFKNPAEQSGLLNAVASASRMQAKNVQGEAISTFRRNLMGAGGQEMSGIIGQTSLTRWSGITAAQSLEGLLKTDNDLINSKDPQVQRKIKEVAALHGKKGYSNMIELSQDIYKSISFAGQGRISTEDIFSSFGGGAAVEKLIQNPSTRGQVLKGRFREMYDAAERRGDTRAMEEAKLAGFADLTGAAIKAPGPAFTNAQFTDQDRAEYNRSNNALGDAQRQIDKLAREGRIDAGSYFGASNGINMSKAVLDFGAYVEMFGQKVKEISPETKPTASGGGLSSFFGGGIDVFRKKSASK